MIRILLLTLLLTGSIEAQFKWSTRIVGVHLSNHQRLIAELEVKLDGAELAKRRGKGEMLIFVQFTDSEGRSYEDHGSIDLEKVEEGAKRTDIIYTQRAFVSPGEYRINVRLEATATKEEAARKESLRVAPLKNDPLPSAWSGLPPVEFIKSTEAPDSWYLPEVKGTLRLPVETKHPLRIEAMVNLTPSERAAGSYRVQDRNLGALLPALKTIAQMERTNVKLNVSLLDLSRQKVTFHQSNVRELDWAKMKASLAEAAPGSIDVKALGDRQHNAAFFVSEVARRIEPDGGQPPVVIVLSSPVEFESGTDLRPIAVGEAGMGARVIYIRYRAPLPPRIVSLQDQRRGGRGRMGGMGMPGGVQLQRPTVDQLESTLKPLNPELYDVGTPEEFRKVLATLVAELSGL